jgi:hypothetical protein
MLLWRQHRGRPSQWCYELVLKLDPESCEHPELLRRVNVAREHD